MKLATIIPFPRGARGLPCVLHKYHYPVPARPTEDHHVQPKFMHGPDTMLNKKPVCPTGHDNVHLYIDWLLKHDAASQPGLFYEYPAPLHLPVDAPPPSVTRTEKAMAIEGYTRWVAMGRPALLAKEAA